MSKAWHSFQPPYTYINKQTYNVREEVVAVSSLAAARVQALLFPTARRKRFAKPLANAAERRQAEGCPGAVVETRKEGWPFSPTRRNIPDPGKEAACGKREGRGMHLPRSPAGPGGSAPKAASWAPPPGSPTGKGRPAHRSGWLLRPWQSQPDCAWSWTLDTARDASASSFLLSPRGTGPCRGREFRGRALGRSRPPANEPRGGARAPPRRWERPPGRRAPPRPAGPRRGARAGRSGLPGRAGARRGRAAAPLPARRGRGRGGGRRGGGRPSVLRWLASRRCASLARPLSFLPACLLLLPVRGWLGRRGRPRRGWAPRRQSRARRGLHEAPPPPGGSGRRSAAPAAASRHFPPTDLLHRTKDPDDDGGGGGGSRGRRERASPACACWAGGAAAHAQGRPREREGEGARCPEATRRDNPCPTAQRPRDLQAGGDTPPASPGPHTHPAGTGASHELQSRPAPPSRPDWEPRRAGARAGQGP